jgi:hypothetical protein
LDLRVGNEIRLRNVVEIDVEENAGGLDEKPVRRQALAPRAPAMTGLLYQR